MDTTGPALTTRSAWRLGQGTRTAQQDALYAGSSLFVVADGFGPHKSAVPADLAISAFVAIDAPWDAGDGDPSAALLAAVAEAERTITAESSALADPNHFGTTLTAALLVGSTLLSAHIGDSRLWLVRDGRAEQLTRDHTVVAALIEEGRLTEDEARAHEDRSLLNRAIVPAGTRGHTDTSPDLATTAVHPGDRLVLTGDGVHAVLDPDHLAALMVRGRRPGRRRTGDRRRGRGGRCTRQLRAGGRGPGGLRVSLRRPGAVLPVDLPLDPNHDAAHEQRGEPPDLGRCGQPPRSRRAPARRRRKHRAPDASGAPARPSRSPRPAGRRRSTPGSPPSSTCATPPRSSRPATVMPDAARPREIVTRNTPTEDPGDPHFLETCGPWLDHPRSYAPNIAMYPHLFAGVFRAIADAPGPVLVHCAAGRDRTGMITAMLLSLTGVEHQAIAEDYERAFRGTTHRGGGVVLRRRTGRLGPAPERDLDGPAAGRARRRAPCGAPGVARGPGPDRLPAVRRARRAAHQGPAGAASVADLPGLPLGRSLGRSLGGRPPAAPGS